MKLLKHTFNSTLIAATAILAVACSHEQAPADALVMVDTEVLTREDLENNMPYGLTADDSTKYAESYIRKWIDDRLIDRIAARNIPDTREIDRMVSEYRRQLILHEYRQKMASSYAQADFPEDSLKAWYERNGKNIRTTSPLIRGIYIKIPSESPVLADVRKRIRSTKQADIDRLEQTGAPASVDYEYFRDRWMEWNRIEAKIPEDFGNDADTWLRNHKSIDVTSGGFVHLLDITDYLPTGSQMPFEEASPLILAKLTADSRREYDRRLRQELYDKALAEGKIVIY